MTALVSSLNDAAFRVEPPAMVSFSGGRTSGYMLWRILRAHGGELPIGVHVVFANTGKERPETLDFVRACAEHWNVRVVWVERDSRAPARFNVVRHATASRAGEPFAQLIRERSFLPNPVTRFCTTELKIRTMKAWMLAMGYEHWNNLVGIRADEPRRIARHKGRVSKERWDVHLPLATESITVADVRAFWSRQPFDLHLRPWEGNCDLCFLKGRAKRERIMRDTPDLVGWWAAQESWAAQTLEKPREKAAWQFRSDTPSYAHLLRIVQQQPMLIPDEPTDEPAADLTDLGDCECDLEAA